MERFDWLHFRDHMALSFIGGCLWMVARIARKLGADPVPPLDPEARRAWDIRRRWFVVVEVAAAPALLSLAALISMWSGWSPAVTFMSGMAAAGVGFPFAVSVMRDFVRRRVIEGGDHDDA